MPYFLRTSILLALCPLLFAADDRLQVITLKDNSVIRAEVREMSGGFYHATSPTLGVLKIPTSDVVSIVVENGQPQKGDATDLPGGNRTAAAAGSEQPADAGSLRSTLSAKVQDLVSTREGMNAVLDFSRNPRLKAVMSDSAVIQAIQSGDYTALMKSPAIKNLIDDPETKRLVDTVLHPQSPSATSANPAPSPATPAK